MSKDEAERAVMLVFHELDQRAGFDDWWAGIDDHIQNEIVAECVRRVMGDK